MKPAAFETFGILVARFHAVTNALVAKGVLGQEDIDAHYPRSEEQQKQI